MHRHWNRWLVVSIAGAAALLMTAAQGGAGDKPAAKPVAPPSGKAGSLAFPAGKTALQVKGDLAKSDPTDAGGKHYKQFTITLTGGKDYSIQMKGSKSLDAYVRLEDSAGKTIREDEFGELNDSGVRFAPAKTAPYRIVCTSYKGGMTGPFTLSVTEVAATPKPVQQPKPVPKTDTKPAPKPPSPAQVLKLDDGKTVTVQGKVTADAKDKQRHAFKAFTFEAQAGKVYEFHAKGLDGFNPWLRIENAAGQTIRNEDVGGPGFSRITFQPSVSGPVRLIVSTLDKGKTGSFTLTGGSLKANRPPTVAAMPAFQPVVRSQIVSQLTRQDGTDKAARVQGFHVPGQAEEDLRHRVVRPRLRRPYPPRGCDRQGDQARGLIRGQLLATDPAAGQRGELPRHRVGARAQQVR